MNMLAMFVAVALAVVAWWLLLQKLRAKPWLAQTDQIDTQFDATLQAPQLIALGVFVAVITALFALFGAAYHMRMAVPDWTHLPLPKLLWINTFFLAASSAALQSAWSLAARTGNLSAIRNRLLAAACLTLAFLAGQILAWRQLDASGFYFSCTPASAFFYVLTGLHGLHLFGGLFVLVKTLWVVYRDQLPPPGNAPTAQSTRAPVLTIKLCALYWHYLLLLWLALYALVALT
jgi:cytochrome c oxidase subunit 3